VVLSCAKGGGTDGRSYPEKRSTQGLRGPWRKGGGEKRDLGERQGSPCNQEKGVTLTPFEQKKALISFLLGKKRRAERVSSREGYPAQSKEGALLPKKNQKDRAPGGKRENHYSRGDLSSGEKPVPWKRRSSSRGEKYFWGASDSLYLGKRGLSYSQKKGCISLSERGGASFNFRKRGGGGASR